MSFASQRLDRWCGHGILGLTLAILVFGPLATGAVRPRDFLVIQGLTLGVLALWTARLWLSRRPQLLWPPLCWVVVAFALYAVARYGTAELEYVARQELMRVLVYAFLFLAIVNNLHGQDEVRIITYTVVFLAMAIAFYALYQFLSDSGRVWHFHSPYKHRGSGTYINPNHLAGFLEMVVPVGLAWALTSRARPLTRVLLGYASLVALAGIVVSLSRGGWIATAVALLALGGVLVFRSGHRWSALLLVALLVAAGAYLVPRSVFIKERLERTVREALAEGRTGDVRVHIWRPALRLWRENPWWGIGPAHFDYRFRTYRPALVQGRPDRAHNDFVNTLVDWGVVGTGLVVAAWVLLYAGVARTWPYARGSLADLGGRFSNKFACLLGGSVGLLALLCHSATDFNMHIPANALLAVTWMALLTGHLRFATERYWVTVRPWARLLASAVLVGGLICLGALGWRRARECRWLAQAEAARHEARAIYTPAEIAARQRAYAVEPNNFENAYELGEALRLQSWAGGEHFGGLATNAMTWYERAFRLNPYDAYSYLRYGMCLDWVGRHTEAGRYIARAAELDPNGYYTVAHVGWHYVQLENYAAARPWFERSRALQWQNNPIATNYLAIVRRKLLELATNAPPGGPPQPTSPAAAPAP